jgi:hypothetical protein
MTRLANISARSKSSRLQTLLFSACLSVATIVAATGVVTIAAAQL